MTWMTPLDARTSALVTVALSTCTTPSSTFTVMVSPLTALQTAASPRPRP
jgi:hypothetical protein